MKTIVLILLMLSCYVLPAAAANPKLPTDDITGVYRCDGGSYSGTVVIQKYGETYQLVWTIGPQTHMGVAIREGELLSSCWAPSNGPPGIVVYRIGPDRKLSGRYAGLGGDGKVFTETLTFVSPLE